MIKEVVISMVKFEVKSSNRFQKKVDFFHMFFSCYTEYNQDMNNKNLRNHI